VKTSIGYWGYVCAFGFVVGAIYWFLTYEPAGTMLLIFMGLCGLVISGYLFLRGRRLSLPEDDPEGSFEDDAGTPIGRFSMGSIWPVLMGLGIALGLEGFIYGRWLLVAGGVLFVWSTVGLMQESRG
jgi:hypothetical protein